MKYIYVLLTIAIVFMTAISCSSEHDSVKDKLEGTWMRTDGTYSIQIVDVLEDGKLDAKYFNPNPINVGRAGWRTMDGEIQIFVELQDRNYPGSLYQLTYSEEDKTLSGTYYQAVSRQTYEVEFRKEIQ
jgi:hypothetical protein